MRLLVYFWSAILRMVKQRMSTWRAVTMGIMLCLMVVNGCDVRPFTGETVEKEDSADEDDDTTDSLMLNANPEEINIAEGTSQQVQVTIENPDSDRTYTFDVTLTDDSGSITQDTEDDESISVTYTLDADFSGTNSLVVMATDDGNPPHTGDMTIEMTVSSL
jgi:hypothetical protein